MFANDLLQSQLSLGAYPGAINPLNSPYLASLQTAFTPQTWAVSPFAQQSYGLSLNPVALAQQQQQLQHLQQLQALASILASQGVAPQMFGVSQLGYPQQIQPQQVQPWQIQQQPNVLQNPLLTGGLQNPLLTAGLQNPLANPFVSPLVNPILAQQLAMQQQNPFAQSGFPLAPQSWVGQQLPGQLYPHHLQQLAARGIY